MRGRWSNDYLSQATHEYPRFPYIIRVRPRMKPSKYLLSSTPPPSYITHAMKPGGPVRLLTDRPHPPLDPPPPPPPPSPSPPPPPPPPLRASALDVQVAKKLPHLPHGVDPSNPRVVACVRRIAAEAGELCASDSIEDAKVQVR